MSVEIRLNVRQEAFSLDVDLQLPSPGISCVFGPSGSGKTTLLRALAGLDRHPGGTLTVDGVAWQSKREFVPTHRRAVGYVFQEASLFEHLDVRRNLEYGLRRVAGGQRKVSLDQAVELLDIGRLMQRRPATLSGGERQRVSIARALAVSPRLLLMDEPLAAIDVARKQEILPYLETLHRELAIPVVYVTHSPEEVGRLADHVVLLEAGRASASGDVHELFTRLDLPLALGAEAATIIEATVRGHDDRYHLTHLEFSGGEFVVTRQRLAVGEPVRVRLAARDVSLTLERHHGTSILNILPAVVDGVSHQDESQVTVRLLTGAVPLLARITHKSAEELGIEPGKRLFAQVKGIALLT